MPGPAKPRGMSRQNELDLTKLDESLDDVPDEVTLGRLQSALEVLLSERSHPMIVELSKQLERLKNAEALIEREREVRGKRRRKSSETAANANGSDLNADNGDLPDLDVDMTRGESRETSSSGSAEDGIDENEEKEPAQRSQNESDAEHGGSSEDASAAASTKTSGSGTKRKRSTSSEDDDDDADSLDSKAHAAAEALTNKPKASSESSAKPGNQRHGAGKGTPGSHMQVEEEEDSAPKGERAAGNQKFVANPKSEFVPTQALPTHTLGLFDENDDDESEEAYKRKLGVVSYPKEDLSTLVAGPVPMEDYTRAKPANQVQWSTYAAFLEPYFRPFADEDIQFLQQSSVGGGVEAANLRGGRKLSPYVIPPLGPWYHQQWAQQDAEIAGTDVALATKKAIASEPQMQASELSKIYQPLGSLQDIDDQSLEMSNGVSLGPFTERLLSALMPEAKEPDTSDASAEPTDAENAVSAIPMPTTLTPPIDDFAHLEERIKGEFRYVGVLDVGLLRKFEQSKSQYKLVKSQHHDEFTDPNAVEVDWVNGSEDDEVCRELRVLQQRLKDVSHRNAQYKQRLLPVVQEQMAWQEYSSILQDLDKQVDQAYAKRLKAPRAPPSKPKKKKSGSAVDSPASFSAADSPGRPLEVAKLPDQKPAVKALLNKRERWIQKIGPLFKEQYMMMRSHETPKFEKLADAEDEDEDLEDRED